MIEVYGLARLDQRQVLEAGASSNDSRERSSILGHEQTQVALVSAMIQVPGSEYRERMQANDVSAYA